MWVYDPPMTSTIPLGRWVGNTGCPAKSSTKCGHPSRELLPHSDYHINISYFGLCCHIHCSN
jgi:hypothetical protein